MYTATRAHSTISSQTLRGMTRSSKMLDTSTSLKGSEDARKKDTEGKGILILDDTLSHHESAKHMEFAGSSMTTPITHSPGSRRCHSSPCKGKTVDSSELGNIPEEGAARR